MARRPEREDRSTQYLFFSGKGGVGKTSMASAAALHYARQGKKTLIISTDPAHSLSDSFEQQIGGRVTKIDKNLSAVEIDPKEAVREYREKFLPQQEKMEFLKGLGLEDSFDLAGEMPGIDEIAAFDKFLQYMQSTEYDMIIFDTAPTGHALRFLSLPDVLDSWIGKIITLRMRLSGIAGLIRKVLPFGDEGEQGFGAGQLERMKERIAQARQILSDPAKTSYHLVLIAEEMSILESERSLKVLKEYGIPVGTVIVNHLVPENRTCAFCSAIRARQQERLGIIRKKFAAFTIREMPQFKEEVKGLAMLRHVGAALCGHAK